MMRRPGKSTKKSHRSGLILVYVVSMLTTLDVVGVSFVHYSDSEPTASRFYQEAAAYVVSSDDPNDEDNR